MARRKTPRNPQESLAISRALRKKFISPEAESTAKRLMAKHLAEPEERPFSDREFRQAAEILSTLRRKYIKH
jgi:hypothetical protein